MDNLNIFFEYVSLRVAAKNLSLPEAGPLNAFCMIYSRDRCGREVFLGNTGVAKNNKEPKWNDEIVTEFQFETSQQIIFRIYSQACSADVQQLQMHDFVGECSCELSACVCARGQRLTLDIIESKRKRGLLLVQLECVYGTRDTLSLAFAGHKLKCADGISAEQVNPLAIISRWTKDEEEFIPVWQSDVVSNNQNPVFSRANIPLLKLCNILLRTPEDGGDDGSGRGGPDDHEHGHGHHHLETINTNMFVHSVADTRTPLRIDIWNRPNWTQPVGNRPQQQQQQQQQMTPVGYVTTNVAEMLEQMSAYKTAHKMSMRSSTSPRHSTDQVGTLFPPAVASSSSPIKSNPSLFQTHMNLVCDEGQRRSKWHSSNLGTLTIQNCVIQTHPSFTEFLLGGCEISFTVAIDFTVGSQAAHLDTMRAIDAAAARISSKSSVDSSPVRRMTRSSSSKALHSPSITSPQSRGGATLSRTPSLLIPPDLLPSARINVAEELILSAALLRRINPYAEVIKSVGAVMERYDPDKAFHAFGFGARVRLAGAHVQQDIANTFGAGAGSLSDIPTHTTTQHCFPLNDLLATDDDEGKVCDMDSNHGGVLGVLTGYENALESVRPSGPRRFAPVIRQASEVAANTQCTQQHQRYMVMFLVTDGAHEDVDDTLRACVEASSQPVSIVVVYVGDDEEQSGCCGVLHQLTGNGELLRCEDSVACRHVVQFVSFRDYGDIEVLVERSLKEIPSQLLQYMSLRGIRPNPPRPAPTYIPENDGCVQLTAAALVRAQAEADDEDENFDNDEF